MNSDTCEATRLCIKKPRNQYAPTKYQFWLNTKGREDLEEIRRAYAEMLGREVSTSLIVRRAFELLSERLQAVRAAGVAEAELAALALLLAT
jgi:hypothetical protein